jgi:hypothetical protein
MLHVVIKLPGGLKVGVWELIAILLETAKREGNVNVYVADMKIPAVEMNETVTTEDISKYGQKYLSILPS